MPDPKKVSPDAALKAALDILKRNEFDYSSVNPRLRALAENYIAESLGGRPFRIIKEIDFKEAVQ
jgi:hypothetical protein